MIETETKYIQHTQFQLLENWSVQYLIESSFFYNPIYKLVKIGNFLRRSRNQIEIEDGKSYQRVTVKINNGGVFPRDVELGKNIGTKLQYLVKEGQFLMSKIDARNGAFGIVPKELEGAVVTNDFPVFDVNKEVINPKFLVLITTTKEFVRFAQSCSSGTTNRQRIDVSAFLNVKIPLPTLEEQDQIVEAYNKRIAEAEKLEAEAKRLEEGIEEYLLKELGINYNKQKEKKKGLNFVNFVEIHRWDSLFLIGNLLSYKSNYKLTKLGNVISKFNESSESKSLRINTSDYPEKRFRFIGMEHIEKDSGVLLDFMVTEGKNIKSQTIQVPQNYFLFGKLRPYLNKYWINVTKYENIVCSSEFFVFSIKDKEIEKRYFKYILSSKIIQEQIADKSSGARMPRINEEIFMNLNIPLPPIEIQMEIANKNDLVIDEIGIKKRGAYSLRQQAITEFESKIFMPCN